jgi:hypothetical protein
MTVGAPYTAVRCESSFRHVPLIMLLRKTIGIPC